MHLSVGVSWRRATVLMNKTSIDNDSPAADAGEIDTNVTLDNVTSCANCLRCFVYLFSFEDVTANLAVATRSRSASTQSFRSPT